MRLIVEKIFENQVDTDHFFVDYKAAFGNPIRVDLFARYFCKFYKTLQNDIK